MEEPQEMMSTKRRPVWARDIVREEERYGAPEGGNIPILYFNYVALMWNLDYEEPICFE